LKREHPLEVRVILFPSGGERYEQLAVRFPAETAARTIRPLVVFALMPKHRANAMR
jgi:hypothetical protein